MPVTISSNPVATARCRASARRSSASESGGACMSRRSVEQRGAAGNGAGTSLLARPGRYDITSAMLRIPDPLSLSAGAGARLALAGLLSAALWAAAFWAMG